MKEDLIIPQHIAIIMDGNRRWAKKRLLPTNMGHKKGAERLEDIANYCKKIGVKYLTVYAFSTENWRRSEEEVNYLMDLLADSISDFDKRFKGQKGRIKLIGDINGLPQRLQDGIRHVEETTKDFTDGTTVNIAINYGGRPELVYATKQIAEDYKNRKISSLDDINEEMISNYIYTKGEPDPDLIIRTGGDIRMSNFLTWQGVYSEFYFTDCLWPDFDEEQLDKAIEDFNNRKRNFGK
ncbi:MAG: di-trans,poly-cis-decaprenylcistransferase [Clostridia bacterium]|nr:di-trans,poly-cis-decaprenylcistransferase [Clostridia bacterium]